MEGGAGSVLFCPSLALVVSNATFLMLVHMGSVFSLASKDTSKKNDCNTLPVSVKDAGFFAPPVPPVHSYPQTHAGHIPASKTLRGMMEIKLDTLASFDDSASNPSKEELEAELMKALAKQNAISN